MTECVGRGSHSDVLQRWKHRGGLRVCVFILLQECTNDCCHASNCTLKQDAQCAHGVCCEGCKVSDCHDIISVFSFPVALSLPLIHILFCSVSVSQCLLFICILIRARFSALVSSAMHISLSASKCTIRTDVLMWMPQLLSLRFQLKQAGTMCRSAAGSCDLPEYCTGGSPYCPSNVYLLDGSSCQYGHAYCYNGMCLTHEQQCLQLWGYGEKTHTLHTTSAGWVF